MGSPRTRGTVTIFGVGTMGSPVEMSQTTRPVKELIEMFTQTRRPGCSAPSRISWTSRLRRPNSTPSSASTAAMSLTMRAMAAAVTVELIASASMSLVGRRAP